MLTTYSMYLPFGLYLRNRAEAAAKERTEPARRYWLQAVLLYLAVAAGVIYNNFSGKSFDVTLPNGKAWNSGDIFVASTLMTLFTMAFVSLLALTILYRPGEVTGEKHEMLQSVVNS